MVKKSSRATRSVDTLNSNFAAIRAVVKALPSGRSRRYPISLRQQVDTLFAQGLELETISAQCNLPRDLLCRWRQQLRLPENKTKDRPVQVRELLVAPDSCPVDLMHAPPKTKVTIQVAIRGWRLEVSY